MGAGICGLQVCGDRLLHEHVHEHSATGTHQSGSVLEAEREKPIAKWFVPEDVWTQVAMELGDMWRFVDCVHNDDAGLHLNA